MQHAIFRKVGGSVMIAIPPAYLEALNIQPGDTGAISIENGKFTAEPIKAKAKRRSKYSLKELLDNTEYPLAPCDREWIDAPAVGKEIL